MMLSSKVLDLPWTVSGAEISAFVLIGNNKDSLQFIRRMTSAQQA